MQAPRTLTTSRSSSCLVAFIRSLLLLFHGTHRISLRRRSKHERRHLDTTTPLSSPNPNIQLHCSPVPAPTPTLTIATIPRPTPFTSLPKMSQTQIPTPTPSYPKHSNSPFRPCLYPHSNLDPRPQLIAIAQQKPQHPKVLPRPIASSNPPSVCRASEQLLSCQGRCCSFGEVLEPLSRVGIVVKCCLF